MFPSDFSIVDVETTGGSSNWDRIIEIGILRIQDNKVVGTYHSLVNPERYVPAFIHDLTGIAPPELERAPTWDSIYEDVYELLKDSVFVAHNVRFDYSFIKNEFRRVDRDFTSKQLCTVKLSRALFPRYKHHNLDSLIGRFDIQCDKRHRAFDDAKVLWEFIKIVQNKFATDKIKKIIDTLLKRPALPPGLTQKHVDSLPESCGVYIFYSNDHTPLYVGKSKNIRDRVLSHFSSDHRSSTEMNISQQVGEIETMESAGELGALLTESKLVKTLQPLYNRQLRIKKDLFVLKKTTCHPELDSGSKDKMPKSAYSEARLRRQVRHDNTFNDVDTVSLEIANGIDSAEFENVYGIFRSRRQASEYLFKISKEFQLCNKILGLEKAAKNCFGYHLGSCNGICAGEESPLAYNMRFTQAFFKTRLRPWPFGEPVVICEGEFNNLQEYFIVDKWCILGVIKDDQDLPMHGTTEYDFDLDTYKILTRYLFADENQRFVKPLSKFKT